MTLSAFVRGVPLPADPNERLLRRLLAVRSGIIHLYMDDGEASGSEHGIDFDFMRDTPQELEQKFAKLGHARMFRTASEPTLPTDAS